MTLDEITIAFDKHKMFFPRDISGFIDDKFQKLLTVAIELKSSIREFESERECQCCQNNDAFISDLRKLIEELEEYGPK